MPACDRFRRDLLHLLCHHTDISSVAAVITEAIETKTILKVAEQNDVVLERDVGSPATTAAAPATAATAATASTTTTTAAAATTTASTAAHA